MSEIIIASFYKFVSLEDADQKQEPIKEFCQAKKVLGTILIAPEGINGTIAGFSENIEAVFHFLRLDPRLGDLQYKSATSQKMPFKRLKIKLKKEIVTLKVPEANPLEQVGTYIDAEQWNDLIQDPEILLIDTRNHYEVEIGTFKGAIDPLTDSFGDFPEYVRQNLDPEKHKKIAMFCTGGIRCEKATAFMLKEGFSEVYHLQGGILEYLRQTKPQDSLWEGECFVFDQRVAVKEGLEEGSTKMCFHCGYPIPPEESQCKHCQLSKFKGKG
jgi:UPF0176 protein